MTLTSDYIYRGQLLSNGNPALQTSIDYDHDTGFFAGAWASTVDLAAPGGRLDIEIDVYLGYHFAPADAVDLSFTVLRHDYPGQTTYRDYGYTEWMATATLAGRYSLEVGVAEDVYGWDSARGYHGEVRGDWPLRSAWVVSAGVGYNDLSDQGTSAYWYWDAGASARFGWLTVDLRWFDNESPAGTLAPLSAGSQFVVSLSAGF